MGSFVLFRSVAAVFQGYQATTRFAEGQSKLQQQWQFSQGPHHHQIKPVSQVVAPCQFLRTASVDSNVSETKGVHYVAHECGLLRHRLHQRQLDPGKGYLQCQTR